MSCCTLYSSTLSQHTWIGLLFGVITRPAQNHRRVMAAVPCRGKGITLAQNAVECISPAEFHDTRVFMCSPVYLTAACLLIPQQFPVNVVSLCLPGYPTMLGSDCQSCRALDSV